ncbi:1498_t:CDS:10 [Acaulospora colombiana]|uniref:1498_t:CDS:1 n=1 Tax=Acaulospora colombiana TaxID=27376 RepID=A0ACA9K2S2_9GLOM|nr:1498_t:CDS:10 [Acaulospora colombiana]
MESVPNDGNNDNNGILDDKDRSETTLDLSIDLKHSLLEGGSTNFEEGSLQSENPDKGILNYQHALNEALSFDSPSVPGSGSDFDAVLQVMDGNGESVREVEGPGVREEEEKGPTSTQIIFDQNVGQQNASKGFFAKNMIKTILPSSWREKDGSSEFVKVIFHAHLPRSIENVGEPVVVGNIKELGKWTDPIIQLQQIYNRSNSYFYPTAGIHWSSEPISIPIASFEQGVKYRYGIYRSSDRRTSKDGDFYFEDGELRNLDIRGGNQFDIVHEIRVERNVYILKEIESRDHTFLDFLVHSLTSDNVKEVILEFQNLAEKFPNYTKFGMNCRFIIDNSLEIKSKEKRIFMCFLLGYYVTTRPRISFGNIYVLPTDFPSSHFIESLEKYNPDRVPVESHDTFLAATFALVRNNSSSGSFDWLKIFAIAHLLDPKYTFIEGLLDQRYNEERLQKLFRLFQKQVTPYVNKIEDPELYARIARWLIRICNNIEIQEIISAGDAMGLIISFEKIPPELRDEVSEVFRRRTLRLFGYVNLEWSRGNAKAVLSILRNSQFNWKEEDFSEALELISQSTKWFLLEIFPYLLEHWFTLFKNPSEKISDICSSWYQQFLDQLADNMPSSEVNDWQFVLHIFEVLSGSITVQCLQEILKYDNEKLIRFFDSAVVRTDNPRPVLFGDDDINKLRKQCSDHEQKLDQFRIFFSQFCPHAKVKDVQDYLDNLDQRIKELKKVKLKETQGVDYWHFYRKVEKSAERAFKLSKSQIFRNIFDSKIQAEEADLTVEEVAQSLMVKVFESYDELCRSYKGWEKLLCSYGSILWKNVTNVNLELDLMRDYVKIERNEKLIKTLGYLSQVPKQIERLRQLSAVAAMFKVTHTTNDWLEKLIFVLEKDYLWLEKLVDFFEIYNKHLSEVDENCWELIKELSIASDFIIFLRSVAEHDIKNLINGVDDSDERLIQEDTVSSLIQVKQFLLPLLNCAEKLSLKEFLHELRGITDANPSLGSKIALCNSSNMALQNMYNNISNRGEVTKEKIRNAVKKGTYTFQRTKKNDNCSVLLTYPSNTETKPYSLSDLQDLRGRALLIAKPAAAVDLAIATVSGSVMQDVSKDIMDEFVVQVDLAQEVLNVASKLILMGHFGYRNFKKSVKGTTALQQLEQELKEQLEQWEDIVNKAQEQHYYLTFFPARHILAFYDYFTFEKQTSDSECNTLIRFVNNGATLPDRSPEYGEYLQKQDYYHILCQIGSKLKETFEKIPRQFRRVEFKGGRVASDIVYRGKLFVAACGDKTLVPNIIMSLYANHGSYPQPWQLLLCTALTTMEELAIFIKRCFFAAKNGYNNHLFCIANLELLDFELQYNLVNNIRRMREMQPDYFLALICCREAGMHHHILDQFSQDVHATSGLGVEAMKKIYQELCPNAFCVSSDLSGQGKTEHIRQFSFSKRKILRSFLISDEVDFGTLVHHLKEFKIRPIESLHINIVSADFPLDVNTFLFELLTLGMVSSNMDIACLPDTPVYIEIASTINQTLLKSLPMVENLANIHLTWDIKNLVISRELNSPIQVVCHYFDAYELSTLDEKDITFNDDSLQPLSAQRCQQLLDTYLFNASTDDIFSFRFVEIFVNVLADQLVRLSSSSFFKVDNLKLMVMDKTIRKTLLETLLQVSKDFATRSIKTKAAQIESTNVDGNERLGTIVQWDDSNHLLVFFLSQTPDSICALYRNKNKVPNNVRVLLKSQYIGEKKWELEDYNRMDAETLLVKLECIARKTIHEIEYPQYALSADNLLKMALILLRARANIPVIVCGEAGCGKTSLIGFLARVVEVEFYPLNLHAGITEATILQFMSDAQAKAEEKEIWLFFDEINTCNHIGLLADLIAHRMLLGKEIHSNIRLFAACNPYRIRTKAQSEVGLQTKETRKYEEQSHLVYQVKPLPDQILDYVWDYGVLQPKEEKKYITIMVSDSLKELSHQVLPELLFESQQFIRTSEEPYSVSLRDVKRAIKLVDFFYKSLKNRPPRRNAPRYPPQGELTLSMRCYILSMGLCYQSRLYDQMLRKKYRVKMCEILRRHGVFIDEGLFNHAIRQEQEDYVNRMTCPPNTAKNEALLENVLVMIVCILTKIPVFIIGAPGSSKSLAIRLVSQNLRGSDSNDEYFRNLPQVYLIPHQGSSSSTSDGILKVFQKAVNYQETSSKEFPVISVVLLDEVGLAETSPFNPLKVLHSLLEPSYPSDGPSVSVVGISNWRLDNSKSSRALLVQRPKFDQEDLVDTAVRLLHSKTNTQITKASLQPLAKAYSEYEKRGQALPNFHGLRDYYALVKSLSLGDLTPENIQMALVRNFGGTDQNARLCEEFFGEVLRAFNNSRHWFYKPIPVEDLINANLDDEGARHLMVIGKSDSIVNLLTYQLRKRGLDPVVILGSQFPDDQDDYSYSVLSRIMMCVEAGRPLILTDLEIIYGSLYDLWNQNYIVVGSADDPKYYTRVALGAYANPMLQVYVAKTFRCILVLDEKKLESADPPLLNRFEKQRMTINDTLSDNQNGMVQQLFDWAKQMSSVSVKNMHDANARFALKDLFIGFDSDETLQSLVIDLTKSYPDEEENVIINKCKEKLIAIASSDGIIRAERSSLSQEEKLYWKNFYFKVQHHDCISDHFHALLDDPMVAKNNPDGLQVIINTFSNINTDIKACLENVISCQVDKLSTFKTESQLQNRVKHFWLESAHQMLVLQCDVTTVNAGCIKLAKFIIEQFRNEFLMKRKQRSEANLQAKHCCIILHVHREQENSLASFNFMCGWDQVTIETLVPQEKSLSMLLGGSLCDVINTAYPFDEILSQELLWCLLCMKYPSNYRAIEHIKILNSQIYNHPRLIKCIKQQAQEWLQEHSPDNWQYNVASSKKLLYPYSSFSVALQAYIRSFVRKPIARVLCALERLSVTRTFFNLDGPTESKENSELLDFWFRMFNDNKIINIEELPEPSPDNYNMPPGIYDLKFPFSYYFMKQIDNFKTLYIEEVDMLRNNSDNIDPFTGELYQQVVENHIKEFTKNIFNMVPIFKSSPIDRAPKLYFKDFVSVIAYNEPGNKDPDILEFVFTRRLGTEKILNPVILHTYWWKHGNSILAELQLAQMIPSIIMQINEAEVTEDSAFERFLVEEASRIMLERIGDSSKGAEIHYLESDQWRHEVGKIIALSQKIPGSSRLPSLQILKFCDDLLATTSFTRQNMEKIVRLGLNGNFNEILSTDFVNTVLGMFAKFPQGEENLVAQRSFILRCLELIPVESKVRLNLYKNLFTHEPLPLMRVIVFRIFKTEETKNKNTFIKLITQPVDTLGLSPRLSIINKSLKITELDSPMAAICCDTIQQEFFSGASFNQMAPFYRHAAAALVDAQVQPLQRIASVAFLKEFTRLLWNLVIQDSLDGSVNFSVVESGGNQLFFDINSSISSPHPLIHSLKIYFLRDLRQRGFASDEIRRFCEAQSEFLPWFNDFKWDNNEQGRLPFNPYWSVDGHAETEKAFSNFYNVNNKAPFTQVIQRLKQDSSIDIRLSMFGIAAANLHFVRSTREWLDPENQVAEYLLKEIESEMSLPEAYKQIIKSILSNDHFLFKLDAGISSGELIMKSVLAYVIGAHASLPTETSTLAGYLHNLQGNRDDFVLACQSDVESMLFNAVAEGGVTRYSCKCGLKYVIANCGGAVVESTCPECKNKIGGTKYNIAAGNTRIDSAPISAITAKDQSGYIGEPLNNDPTYCVRKMSPASYRILHFFVHAIISVSKPSVLTNFLKKNNDNANNAEKYCMDHIKNDWEILKKILNASDENLASLIHSIVNLMIKFPFNHPIVLNTSLAREDWEDHFTQIYVTPQIISVAETATNFRTRLDQALNDAQVIGNLIEGEINQTFPMDIQYCQEYLPRLWRTIGVINFESFRAFYFKDIALNKKKEAERKTFKNFIEEESNKGHLQETFETLTSAFNEFAKSWNLIIDHVTRYQCHTLPEEKPKISVNSPIVFGLMEGRDTGIFLCAILEYLVTLQNNFLQEVMDIPAGTCQSLRFLQESSWKVDDTVPSSSKDPEPATATPNPYYMRSKKIELMQEENFINYDWDESVLQYSQHNLGIGRGQDIIFDLSVIESKLAQQLVFEKVHIEGGAEQQLYMDPFPYHMELFQGSMRILGEIKVLIPQEPIPVDKISIITGTSINVYQQPTLTNYSIDNASELLSFLEILLCFVKRTSVGDGEILLKDFVDQWMKLSNLMIDTEYKNLLDIDLNLKHVIALYELVEDQVANLAIKYIPEKFTVALDRSLEDEIVEAVDFEQKSTQIQRLPADAFAIALKRFMQRFLSVESNKEKHPLSTYLTDMTLSLWPPNIDEELVDTFPMSLLVEHTYEAYKFTMDRINVRKCYA